MCGLARQMLLCDLRSCDAAQPEDAVSCSQSAVGVPPAPPARGCCHHYHVNSPLKRYLCRLPEILIQLIVIVSTTFSAKRLILRYLGCEEITRTVTSLLKEIRQQRRSVSN